MDAIIKRIDARKSKKRKPNNKPNGGASGSSMPPSRLNSGVLIMSRSRLGSGSYGWVVKGTFHNPDLVITNYEGTPLMEEVTYAIKVQNKQETEHEVAILRMLGIHDYIMTLYGTAKPPDGNEKYLMMVVEKADKTLFQCCNTSIHISMRRAGFVRTAFQMFEAIAFLESRQVVHLDLHSGNIMFKGDDPMLIDFGLAKVTGGGSIVPFTGNSVTRWRYWHPPEQRVWDGNTCKYAPVTTKYDVFSIAVNLLSLIYDPRQNEGRLGTNDFYILLKRALLQTNESDFRFVTLDKRLKEGFDTGTGSSVEIMTPVLSMTLKTMYTCFRIDEHPILQLYMPGRLAEIFKRCVLYERWRPLASKIVKDIDAVYPSASSEFPDVFSDDDYLQDMTLRF